jgi:hypothetical protein
MHKIIGFNARACYINNIYVITSLRCNEGIV